jgi:hypothetical protein
MRRKLKTLRAKQGHTQNGADRALIDDAMYREKAAHNAASGTHYDSEYAGWSWASRPQDQAITLRRPFSPSIPQIQ